MGKMDLDEFMGAVEAKMATLRPVSAETDG
jgi:hypothetical protein